MHTLTIILLAVLWRSTATKLWLTFRHASQIPSQQSTVLHDLSGTISLQAPQADDNTHAQSRFCIIDLIFRRLLSHMQILKKHEFETDSFTAEQTNAVHHIKVLGKPYSKGINPLMAVPAFSAIHDSHPPAPVRITFLSSKMKVANEEYA